MTTYWDEIDEVDLDTPCENLEVSLNFPRGSIKTGFAAVKRLEYKESIIYKAWIYMAGRLVEYQQTAEGMNKIDTYLPYNDDDTYLDYGDIEYNTKITSFQAWKDEITKYVSDRDPRDAFIALARNHLI